MESGVPEWLQDSVPGEPNLSISLLALRLLLALVLGLAVAAVYFLTQRKRRVEAAAFVATLVLMTILIAIITQVIGNSVARAFSLAGALSIIRFRAAVDDTRDTAFVIFAVVIGMAAGAGLFATALIGIPIVGLAAVMLRWWGRHPGEKAGHGTLSIRIGVGTDPEATYGAVLARYLSEQRFVGASSARGGASLDLIYDVSFKPTASAVALIGELQKIDGVQGVEWKNRAIRDG